MPNSRTGFSLVELLVVIAISSLLLGLLLPAVQSSREAGRRTECASNLHNHAAALAAYHDAYGRFPPGRLLGTPSPTAPPLDFSWAAQILAELEQSALASRLDLHAPWNAPANRVVVETPLPIFRCPSSVESFPGDTDYGGVLGTAMNTVPGTPRVSGAVFNRGVLIAGQAARDGVDAGQITDGLSKTWAVVECADLSAEDGGYWASGVTGVSHDAGRVNEDQLGIYSLHPGGAHAAHADGSVHFYADDVEPLILGALCTRASEDGP